MKIIAKQGEIGAIAIKCDCGVGLVHSELKPDVVCPECKAQAKIKDLLEAFDEARKEVAFGLAAGTMYLFFKDKKQAPPSEVIEAMNAALRQYSLPLVGETVIEKFTNFGFLIKIIDEITPSARGAVMFKMAIDKVAVAEITGDDYIFLDQEEKKNIRESSRDLPGSV